MNTPETNPSDQLNYNNADSVSGAQPPDEELNSQAGKRLLHFEDCSHAIDQLFRSALKTDKNMAFDKFVGVARDFNNLSVYNAMLVQLQRPGAAMVGNRKQWREIGRYVLPDAVPVVILWPFGPVQFLFELSDTEGKELPGQELNSLFAKGDLPECLYERTIQAAAKYDISVFKTDQYGTNQAGTAADLEQYPKRMMLAKKRVFRVKLNSRHNLPTQFATLAHELGHIYCGHLGADTKGRWPARRLSREVMELEAEAVAWLVCQRAGITTRSKEYLNSLIDEVNLQAISMYAIYEAANRVESRTVPKKG